MGRYRLSSKGENVSKCSQHSPVDSSVVTSRDLKIHKIRMFIMVRDGLHIC